MPDTVHNSHVTRVTTLFVLDCCTGEVDVLAVVVKGKLCLSEWLMIHLAYLMVNAELYSSEESRLM